MRWLFVAAVAVGAVLALPGTAAAQNAHSVVGTDTFPEEICGVSITAARR
jgi:hypothetical protein